MLSGLPQGLFLDAFFTLSHSTEDGPLSNSQNVLKALRWYKKLLVLSCLPDLYGPAFSLLSSPATQEKRESVPLPLAFLVFLEKLLLSGSWGNAYGPAPSWCLWARAFAFQTANISSGARFALAVSHFTLRLRADYCYRLLQSMGEEEMRKFMRSLEQGPLLPEQSVEKMAAAPASSSAASAVEPPLDLIGESLATEDYGGSALPAEPAAAPAMAASPARADTQQVPAGGNAANWVKRWQKEPGVKEPAAPGCTAAAAAAASKGRPVRKLPPSPPALHTDAGNALNSLNHTLSLGNFSGGEVWLHPALHPGAAISAAPAGSQSAAHPEDVSRLGEVVDAWRKPTCETLHCTMPWQGDRWVLTAYTCRNLESFTASQLAHLRSLGFPLPSQEETPAPKLPTVPGTGASFEVFLDLCISSA
eukprot:s3862_g5.t1